MGLLSLLSNLKAYFEESEQFLVYLVHQRRAHVMRRAFVNFQLRVLDDLGREHGFKRFHGLASRLSRANCATFLAFRPGCGRAET